MKKEEEVTQVTQDYFFRFWESYPPRKGDRGMTPARALFDKAVKSGVDPEVIIQSALRYAASEMENFNTPFIMQAQRWLRNERWLDYQFSPTAKTRPASASNKVFILEGTKQWSAWQRYLRALSGGRGSPCVNFGWWFEAEWPPGEPAHAQV